MNTDQPDPALAPDARVAAPDARRPRLSTRARVAVAIMVGAPIVAYVAPDLQRPLFPAYLLGYPALGLYAIVAFTIDVVRAKQGKPAVSRFGALAGLGSFSCFVVVCILASY